MKFKPRIFFTFFLINCFLHHPANSYKILGLFHLPGQSHAMVFNSLLIELANRGHNVTVYDSVPNNESIPNYRHVDLSSCFHLSMDLTMDNMTPFLNPLTAVETLLTLEFPDYEVIKACKLLMELLDSDTASYDLVITEMFNTDFLLYFAYKLKIPYIGMVTNSMFPWVAERTGSPSNPSYIPDLQIGYLSEMNFFQRLRNTYVFLMSMLMYEYLTVSKANDIGKKLLGPSAPPVKELTKNVSLVLTYTHFTRNPVRPLPPNVIEIGGITIKPASKIDKVNMKKN